MTNPLYTSEKLPTSTLEAKREFDDRYLAALGASQADTWADEFGALFPTSAPMITFPIAQLRAKYRRFHGEASFRSILDKSFDIKAEEFQDGYEAELYKIFTEVWAYKLWQQAPGRFIEAEKEFRIESVAALLEAGASTALGYDSAVNFFSTSHKANFHDASAGTWGNLSSGGKTVLSLDNIQDEVSDMMTSVKDENGKLMRVQPDTIIVPVGLELPLTVLLAQNLVANFGPGSADVAIDNPWKGKLRVIGARDLTDANDWYLVDSNLAKQIPLWITMRQNMPASLANRFWDESSDFFKNTGRIKVSSHIWYGFGLAFPYAIRKVVGA